MMNINKIKNKKIFLKWINTKQFTKTLSFSEQFLFLGVREKVNQIKFSTRQWVDFIEIG